MNWQWQSFQTRYACICIGQIAVIRAQYLSAQTFSDGRKVFDFGTPRAGFLAVSEENKCFYSA